MADNKVVLMHCVILEAICWLIVDALTDVTMHMEYMLPVEL